MDLKGFTKIMNCHKFRNESIGFVGNFQLGFQTNTFVCQKPLWNQCTFINSVTIYETTTYSDNEQIDISVT